MKKPSLLHPPHPTPQSSPILQNLLAAVKTLPQCLHMYTFGSAGCLNSLCLSSRFWVRNSRLHLSQGNGFSFVLLCVFRWYLNDVLRKNSRPHWLHLNITNSHEERNQLSAVCCFCYSDKIRRFITTQARFCTCNYFCTHTYMQHMQLHIHEYLSNNSERISDQAKASHDKNQTNEEQLVSSWILKSCWLHRVKSERWGTATRLHNPTTINKDAVEEVQELV